MIRYLVILYISCLSGFFFLPTFYVLGLLLFDLLSSGILTGLPAAHFGYVKHIDLGMPLFLLNYSRRALHGVFEAASTGQMNINPYGWSRDG